MVDLKFQMVYLPITLLQINNLSVYMCITGDNLLLGCGPSKVNVLLAVSPSGTGYPAWQQCFLWSVHAGDPAELLSPLCLYTRRCAAAQSALLYGC